MRLTLKTPEGFDFWRTAFSHGWCDLPPFSHNVQERRLDRVLLLGGVPVFCSLTSKLRHVRIEVTSPVQLTALYTRHVREQLATCLRLDEDLSEFHAEARKDPATRWIARSGSGRMLRAPTVFEDAVKMICTTNCTWALTKLMVTRLVTTFGVESGTGHCTFPEPGAIARSTESVLRRKCSTGYRAPYLLELARRVAEGNLDLESLRRSTKTTPELFQHLRSIRGVGPYAAGNILKLLGRYDHLGLDSWVRSQYCKLHHGGRRVKDATIERAYRGKWRGLFFWLEMTRDWHEEKFST